MSSRKHRTRPSAAGKARSRKATRNKRAVPRTPEQYRAKPEKFKDTWESVLAVISKMRSEKTSLNRASRDVGISPHTVVRWGSAALQKSSNGRYATKTRDNLLRVLKIPTPEGAREIAVRGSRQSTQLAEYWNAVHRYLQTGDASQLDKFRGKYIKDSNGVQVLLPTDLAELNRLGSAGVLSFESIYARSV